MNLSYWEREHMLHYDIIIIGGGLVGMSTALNLSEELNNGERIALIERGGFPSGASTKNAGFACIGSLTEILSELEKLSESEVCSLVEKRLRGLHLLRERLGDEHIDYRENGSHELLVSANASQLDQLERINGLLKPVTGKSAFSDQSKTLNSTGFNMNHFVGMIRNECEGEINTGKMMDALSMLCAHKGIRTFTGLTVDRFEQEEQTVHLSCSFGVNKQLQIKASTLAICTNAFSKDLLPQVDLQAGRGCVLVTKPVKNLPFKGIFHMDSGYFYFRRLQDDRILFGGGRNEFLEEETTTSFGVNQKIENLLLEKLRNDILPDRQFEHDYSWSGIMAFSKDRKPFVKKVRERIFVGIRLNGMGVAIGSCIGQELAQLIIES